MLKNINKVKYRHCIGIPKTCGYQNCGGKTGFNVRAMFDQYYLALTVLHNILYNIFAWKFYHFTSLPILEGDIIGITNYDYDKYLSISTWGKPGGSCDKKLN